MSDISSLPTPNQLWMQKLQQLKATTKKGSELEDSKLKKASVEFEALFVNQIMTTMRDSIPDSGIVPKSHGEKIFQSMLDGEYSKMAAEMGTFGLGKSIYQQLKTTTPKQKQEAQVSVNNADTNN